MQLSTLLAISSLFTAGVIAQDYTFPPGFNSGAVGADEKSSWCSAQLNTCPQICGGFAKDNRCNAGSLAFKCVCGNGTTPDVAKYTNTLPFFVCQANFGQCIKNSPDDAAAQKKCKNEQSKCGKLKASESDSSSKTTLSTTSSSKPTATETEAATTTTSTAATTSATNGAVPIRMAQDYSLGILATVLLGAFGFLA